MIQLNKTEARIYELLMQGHKQDKITVIMEINRQSVADNLNKLVSYGLAMVDRSARYPVFTAIPDREYEIVSRFKGPRNDRVNPYINIRTIKRLMLQYGKDNVRFVKYQFDKAPLSYISEKTGLAPKDIQRIAFKLEAVSNKGA